jgi:hypothetical protein
MLDGSCHCGAVRFRVESPSPYPYQECYCSICRKTAGGGGFAINLGADARSLRVEGEDNVTVYRARLEEPGRDRISPAKRHFCRLCGSALWLYDPRWPELVHPFASAIDTPLPRPPERVRIMLEFAAPWCEMPEGGAERHFPRYPDESLEDWHRRRGLYDEPRS